MKFYIATAALLAITSAQQYTTPVPILKQINRHNEDGSYSYGYEAADGSYKIESKYPNGEVFGKYGYVDDKGKVREIEYGASKRGFEPAGNEINVPPPTLTQNNNFAKPLGPNEEDDGQYREDPSVYYKNDPNNIDPPRTYNQPQQQSYNFGFNQNSIQQPSYQQQPRYQQQPAYQQPQPTYQQPQPTYRPQNQYNVAQTVQSRFYNPAPPAYPNFNQFGGHPASNLDIVSGSYTVNYRK